MSEYPPVLLVRLWRDERGDYRVLVPVDARDDLPVGIAHDYVLIPTAEYPAILDLLPRNRDGDTDE